MDPLLTHSIDYLRMVANVAPHWQVFVHVIPLCLQRSAALQFSLVTYRAAIELNSEYVFTPAAASRAIMHELLELSLAELWAVVAHHDNANEIRRVRDEYIERRIRQLALWDVTDLPIMRKELDRLCPSFPSKAVTKAAKQPKLKYCLKDWKNCVCPR